MIFRKLFRPLFDVHDAGGGGTATLPEWITALVPEDARKDPSLSPLFNPDAQGNPPDLSKHKTAVDFLKNYANLNTLVGRKGVIVPADMDKAKPEELEAYYTGIGRPAKPGEYKFSEIKDLHPALKIDEKQAEGFKQFLWEKGVPARQADAFNQYATNYLSKMLKDHDVAVKQYQEKSITELKAEWGDNYQANVDGATKLVKAVLGDKAADLGVLENSPSGLRFLQKISTLISEDSIAKITTGGGSQMPEQDQALKDIEDIKADSRGAKNHPLNDEKHPDHSKWAGATGLWAQLHEKAYGKA